MPDVDSNVGTVTGAEGRSRESRSLRTRAVTSSFWSLAGRGSSQALRLAGNLVLTRLLFPEAFSLMAVLQVLMIGVNMMSDVGLRGSVIHHKRGNDPAFLDTVWTTQVIRGLLIWGIICLVTVPAASFYRRPELCWFLPVAGLEAVLLGFASTAKLTLLREVDQKRPVILEVLAQSAALLVTILLAWILRSAWALVLGGLVRAAFQCGGSFLLIPGYRNRFSYDRKVARSLFRFGRWVFLGTALMFLLGQGDRMVLGRLLSEVEFGVYAIAALLAGAVVQVMNELARSVLHPLYAHLLVHEAGEARQRMFRTRLVLLAVGIPPCWILLLAGEPLIEWLYDPRYVEAGWMVRLLALGAVGTVVGVTADRALLAVGDSLSYLLVQVARTVVLVGLAWAGFHVGGFRGFLLGLAVARMVEYPFLAVFLRRLGVWYPAVDLPVLGLTLLMAWAGGLLSV